MNYEQTKKQILNSPCTHYMLINVIKQFDGADPVDALKDATTLQRLMDLRCREMLGVKAS